MPDFADHLRAFKRPATVEVYSLAARKLDAFLAGRPMTPNTLVEFAHAMLTDQKLAPRSVRLFLAGARTYLRWLSTQGTEVPAQNPVPGIRMRRSHPAILRGEAIPRYLEACDALREPYRTLARLLPLCGLRIREACRLTLADVRPSRETWLLTIRDSKGDDRVVPVLMAGNSLLRAYLRVRAALPEVAGRAPLDQYLFPSRTGGPASPRVAREGLRRIRKTLGHPTLAPHLLRHTYATLLEEAGTPALTIMEVMGHHDLRTTQGYTHPSVAAIIDHVRGVQIPEIPE